MLMILFIAMPIVILAEAFSMLGILECRTCRSLLSMDRREARTTMRISLAATNALVTRHKHEIGLWRFLLQ